MKRMALGLLIVVAVLVTTGCAPRPNTNNNYRYRDQGQQYNHQYQNPYYRHEFRYDHRYDPNRHRYDPNRYDPNRYDPYRRNQYPPGDYWRRQFEPNYDPYDPYYRRYYDPAMVENYRMLRLHNDYRLDKYDRYGRSLLQLRHDYALNRIAQDHAEYMARINRLTNYGYNNERPWDRVTREISATAVAQNIAIGSNERMVFEKWLRSSSHKRTIEGDYRRIGIGRALGSDGSIFWCVIYIK